MSRRDGRDNGIEGRAVLKTRVVLTVDTEPSVAGALLDAKHRPLIDEPVAGNVGGKSEALGFLLDTLGRHGLVATFFVETVHVRALPASAMGRYVDQILAAGQDVQLYIHPVWRTWRDGRIELENRSTDECAQIDRTELGAMMLAGCAQILAWTGRAPTGMRTGNFSTAMPVFEAAADVGLAYASNLCLSVRRPPEPELALAGGAATIAGVRELPVTCFADRGVAGRGRLRSLQVNAISSTEMTDMLSLMHDKGEPVAVIVTHPFDLLKRRDKQFNGMRADRLVQARWTALCAFLAANPDRFETTTLAGAASTVADTPPPKLVGHPIHATARTLRNYVNDRYV